MGTPHDTRARHAVIGAVGALLLAAGVFSSWVLRAAVRPAIPTVTVFDADANHIWNRTYACLMVRQAADGKAYGADTPDPLLWDDTKHLLEGESHRRALGCLDEFLRAHAERAIRDPLKRGVLQHDLWAVFDWAAAHGEQDADHLAQRRALCLRLAEIMRRLALTSDEIRALPDNYAGLAAAGRFATAYAPGHPEQAFLPDLFRPDSPWVCLSAYLEGPTTIGHFTGRSRFLVFLRLPGARAETLAYLEKLRSSHEPPMLADPSDTSQPAGASIAQMHYLNLRLPQFPVATQVALVRQMVLINNEGKLAPTALADLVEMRGYRTVTAGSHYMNDLGDPARRDQDFFEFRMSRAELFANRNGGLVAVAPGERDYPTFATHGMDPFESREDPRWREVILDRCIGCHINSGIHSVQSRLQWLNPERSAQAPLNPWDLSAAISWETDVTIARKKQQPEFLMLQRMWNGAHE
jgi:hypothetical protein